MPPRTQWCEHREDDGNHIKMKAMCEKGIRFTVDQGHSFLVCLSVFFFPVSGLESPDNVLKTLITQSFWIKDFQMLKLRSNKTASTGYMQERIFLNSPACDVFAVAPRT